MILRSRNPQKSPVWRKTPRDILRALHALERSVDQLKALGRKAHLPRNFTLDGRLVGDVGELIVARHFKIVPDEKPKGHAHDLYAKTRGHKYGVQVKLRRAAGNGKIAFNKAPPDILMVIQFKNDWTLWRVVYHGSGRVLEQNAYQKGMTLTQLQNENKNPMWQTRQLTPRAA